MKTEHIFFGKKCHPTLTNNLNLHNFLLITESGSLSYWTQHIEHIFPYIFHMKYPVIDGLSTVCLTNMLCNMDFAVWMSINRIIPYSAYAMMVAFQHHWWREPEYSGRYFADDIMKCISVLCFDSNFTELGFWVPIYNKPATVHTILFTKKVILTPIMAIPCNCAPLWAWLSHSI